MSEIDIIHLLTKQIRPSAKTLTDQEKERIDKAIKNREKIDGTDINNWILHENQTQDSFTGGANLGGDHIPLTYAKRSSALNFLNKFESAGRRGLIEAGNIIRGEEPIIQQTMSRSHSSPSKSEPGKFTRKEQERRKQQGKSSVQGI